MARTKLYDGRKVPLSLTARQDKAVSEEAARRDLPRAEVIRQLINEKLLGVQAEKV